jgi:hypothetical protein
LIGIGFMSFLPILLNGIMEKQWVQRISYDSQLVEQTAANIGVPLVYAPLFLDRGLSSLEQASKFCNPSLDQLIELSIVWQMLFIRAKRFWFMAIMTSMVPLP